ncbi:unnamed protein product [Calypogeia fissa]
MAPGKVQFVRCRSYRKTVMPHLLDLPNVVVAAQRMVHGRSQPGARIADYCEQNNIHSPAGTVHESLIFSAWLCLDREINDDMKRDFVQEVMDLVELAPLKDDVVGTPGESGLSTEQRKPLTISVELVANPSIIFMDEPTSGLDAGAAARVMRAVRNTVDTGRTIVCTIHQPSIDIFDSFDELLLLTRGGRVIYHGPLGLHWDAISAQSLLCFLLRHCLLCHREKIGISEQLYSLMGSIFSSQMFYGLLTSTAIQPLINASRTVFYRERSAHMYSEFPYAIAQCVIELPYVFTSSVLYSSLSYTLIKMYWKADKFFWYLYFVFCSQITFSYWGMMTVSLTPTPQLATILGGCFYNIWSFFSGFFIPHPKFPVWWKWAYWLDPISYNIYGTLVSQNVLH